MTKLIVAFRKFENAHKNRLFLVVIKSRLRVEENKFMSVDVVNLQQS